jgi:hypothetical protein
MSLLRDGSASRKAAAPQDKKPYPFGPILL